MLRNLSIVLRGLSVASLPVWGLCCIVLRDRGFEMTIATTICAVMAWGWIAAGFLEGAHHD